MVLRGVAGYRFRPALATAVAWAACSSVSSRGSSSRFAPEWSSAHRNTVSASQGFLGNSGPWR